MEVNNSAQKGSDQLFDFCCFTCQENGTNIEARFYCQRCSNCFCNDCIKPHGQLYKKHEVVGRENMETWPVGQTMVERLEQCREHPDKKVEFFCEDHNRLCCYQCQFNYHRNCSNVGFIAEKSKGVRRTTDFSSLLVDIGNQKEQFNKLKHELFNGLQDLQESHSKGLEEIKAFRKKITDYFDELEKKATDELNKCLHEVQQSYQTEIDQCTNVCSELHYLGDALKTIAQKSEALSFILQKKYTELSHTNEDVKRKYITFQKNSKIDKFVTNLSHLGTIVVNDSKESASKLITVAGNPSLYKVKITGDLTPCYVTSFYELPDGKIILTDRNNKRVKLLNGEYNVVSHLDFPDQVWALCGVNNDQIAITVNGNKVHEVTLVKVVNEKIVKNKTLTFQHSCTGITYARTSASLYLTSGTALYQYTLCGYLVHKLYEDTASDKAVFKCAMSPDETKIYVADFNRNAITLFANDGNIISTFSSLQCKGPNCIHVTTSGQVLVSANMSDSIQQVDSEGEHASTTVIGADNGVIHPGSVFYSLEKGVVIVGLNSDNIIVFKAQ